MAQNKKKPLSDEEVLSLVEHKVKQGVGWFDSKISLERERILKYYNLKLPLRQSEGKSSYVSSDVYDAVESMKSQLLETFAGNPDGLISFPPQGQEDIAEAKQATEYTNYQIFRLNDAFGTFQSVIHDGLTSRIGVTKVFWEKIEEEVEEEVVGSFQDMQALASREDVTDMEAEIDPASGQFKGKITRKENRSKVTLLPVPPEEFIVESNATSLETAGMLSHRTLKTRAELKKQGYDPAKVDSIAWDDARSLDLSPEVIARQEPVNSSTGPMDDAIQPEVQKVMLYETFVRMNMQDGRGVRLWKVCHGGHVLLDKQEVNRAPFKVLVPLPVPHTIYGNNFAGRAVPYQNARTLLTRAILDHASVTTNPRWGVVKGGLMNPKEMLDNRLGGLVNMTRPDAVKPLEQHNLNPFVFQTLEMLKGNKEETLSISALSQGLDKDAISNQNSRGLVQDLVTLSQGRQKTIARNFAYGYLIPLYLEVYQLVIENETQERIVELTGNFVKVDPRTWRERVNCKVALHLGYGDKDKQVAKSQALYRELASDPGLGTMFAPQNRYDLIMDTLKMDGSFENYAKYLTPPEKAATPQPDPLKVQEVQAKDKTATAALVTAQASALKNAKTAEVAANKELLNELKMHIDSIFKAREQDRQDADTANRIDVAQREIKLAEEAPQTDQNVIVSANS